MNDSAAAEPLAAANSSIHGHSTRVTPDKDAPLFEDIRLLGRLLGDVIRDQEGEEVFAVVERIRLLSVQFHRDTDPLARAELDALLNNLTREQTNLVVRAFSFFSHLANIAEDQHHIRRARAHALAGSKPHEGSFAHAVERALLTEDEEDRAIDAGFVDGDLAAVRELAMALRAHAARMGATRARAWLPEVDWLREAFASAGYGFGEWHGEMCLYERRFDRTEGEGRVG